MTERKRVGDLVRVNTRFEGLAEHQGRILEVILVAPRHGYRVALPEGGWIGLFECEAESVDPMELN